MLAHTIIERGTQVEAPWVNLWAWFPNLGKWACEKGGKIGWSRYLLRHSLIFKWVIPWTWVSNFGKKVCDKGGKISQSRYLLSP